MGRLSEGVGGPGMGLIPDVLKGLIRGKFSPRQTKTRPLGSKMGNKNYYKGKGGLNMGKHTKRGGFIVQREKVPMIVAPDWAKIEASGLKPYVAHNTPKV